jgi:hypothetical protein
MFMKREIKTKLLRQSTRMRDFNAEGFDIFACGFNDKTNGVFRSKT